MPGGHDHISTELPEAEQLAAHADSDPPPSNVGRWFARIVWLAGMVIILFLVSAWYQGTRISEGMPGVEELRRGSTSQVIRWRGTDQTAVQFSRLYPGSADHFWKVVTDQGRFDEFMPFVDYTRVKPGPHNTRIEEQRLDLPFGDEDLVLEIIPEEDGNRRTARWRQVKGSLQFNEGAWIVERAGDQTILRYQVAASVNYIPDWIVNYAMLKRLGTLLDAVQNRVMTLEASNPGYFETEADPMLTTGSFL